MTAQKKRMRIDHEQKAVHIVDLDGTEATYRLSDLPEAAMQKMALAGLANRLTGNGKASAATLFEGIKLGRTRGDALRANRFVPAPYWQKAYGLAFQHAGKGTAEEGEAAYRAMTQGQQLNAKQSPAVSVRYYHLSGKTPAL